MAAEAEGRIMAEDRIAVLEERLAAVERAVAALAQTNHPATVVPPRKDPLEGHRLISKRIPPEEAAAYEARRRKELGLENVPPITLAELRQLMIERGVDPNANEASRELIAMREEEG
jgi:hypothetical protein